MGGECVAKPDRTILFFDHYAPCATEKQADNHRKFRAFGAGQGITYLMDINEGVCRQLKAGGVKVVDIHDLKAMAEKLTGVPRKLPGGSREVAKVIYRDGTQIDSIRCVK